MSSANISDDNTGVSDEFQHAHLWGIVTSLLGVGGVGRGGGGSAFYWEAVSELAAYSQPKPEQLQITHKHV